MIGLPLGTRVWLGLPRAGRRARSLPSVVGIQSENVEAYRCRNLNGGFNRFL